MHSREPKHINTQTQPLIRRAGFSPAPQEPMHGFEPNTSKPCHELIRTLGPKMLKQVQHDEAV